jgi:hypothetical protein
LKRVAPEPLPFFEIALVLMRLDHIASIIVKPRSTRAAPRVMMWEDQMTGGCREFNGD